MCGKLTNLDLTNNNINELSDYRSKVKGVIPTLLILDGFAAETTNDIQNPSECSSSLTSEFSKNTSSISSSRSSRSLSRISFHSIEFSEKHLTVGGGATSHCSTEEPVVGNVINKVRYCKRHVKENQGKTIFGNSSSTSVSSSSSSSFKYQITNDIDSRPCRNSKDAAKLVVINNKPTTSAS